MDSFKIKFISKTKLPRITEENFLGLMLHKPREICLEKEVFNYYAAKNFLGFSDVFPFQVSDIVRVTNKEIVLLLVLLLFLIIRVIMLFELFISLKIYIDEETIRSCRCTKRSCYFDKLKRFWFISTTVLILNINYFTY